MPCLKKDLQNRQTGDTSVLLTHISTKLDRRLNRPSEGWLREGTSSYYPELYWSCVADEKTLTL
jgi:hypothetical protein